MGFFVEITLPKMNQRYVLYLSTQKFPTTLNFFRLTSGVTHRCNGNIIVILLRCFDEHKKSIFQLSQNWYWLFRFTSQNYDCCAIFSVTKLGASFGEILDLSYFMNYHPWSFMNHGNHAMIMEWFSAWRAMTHGWIINDSSTTIRK